LIRARPELSVGLKGPLAAPDRKLDVSALVGWLTLRATEQQTRRLESLEANRRADVLGDFARPAPPSLRFIPRGTALEINNRANTAAAPPSGTNGLDRLRSEIPAPATAAVTAAPPSPAPALSPSSSPGPSKPVPPSAAPGADKTTATAGTAQPTPQQGIRSLLNSLFGSQN
jgi:large subunit ribosomal protein L24